MKTTPVLKTTGSLPGPVLREAFLLLVLWICSTFASAQSSLDEIGLNIKSYERQTSTIARQLVSDKIPDDSLDIIFQQLLVLGDSLAKDQATIKSLLSAANESLKSMGPAPKSTEPPEIPSISEQRQKLTNRVSDLSGLSSEISLLVLNVNQLLDQNTKLRQSKFIDGLTKRNKTPFSWALWKQAGKEFFRVKFVLSSYVSLWVAQKKSVENGLIDTILILISLALYAILLRFTTTDRFRKITASLRKSLTTKELEDRLFIAAKALTSGLLAILGGSILYWTTWEIGLWSHNAQSLAQRLCFGPAMFVFAFVFSQSFLRYGQSLSPHLLYSVPKAKNVRRWFLCLIALFILDRIFIAAFELVDSGIELLMIQAIISSLLMVVFFVLIFHSSIWKQDVLVTPSPTLETTHRSRLPGDNKINFESVIRTLGLTIAVVVLLSVVLSYIRLADFVFHRTVLLILLLMLFWSIRVLSFWGLTQFIAHNKHFSDAPDSNKSVLNFILWLALNLNLFAIGLPIFLMVIGFDWLDLDHWFHVLTSNIQIGAVSLSLTNILTGVFVFFLIIMATRWLTGYINKRLIEFTHIDAGLRNSIITLIHYFCILIAILSSFPIIGISFAKIALVAGALSVGIGFGLQSIVNNFVSGLILLFERPIKVGDWIVVSSGQGFVKRIRVRSTEIRTFDESTIIIPNSELVSSSVQNWFFKNRTGRIVLNVGVGYESNPEQVREILLACAEQHPAIVGKPDPSVIWKDFGDSSLDFELRAYLNDFSDSYTTQSELRFSIFKKFKEVGISLPFPQRDVHFYNNEKQVSEEAGKSRVSRKKGVDEEGEKPGN